MSWIRLDDHFHRNSKQLQLSDGAFRVWVCSWSYCAEEKQLTGFMTTAQARSLTRSYGKPLRVIEELVKANAWEQVSDGYLIHDFEKYLDVGSAERTRKWRAEKRERDALVTSPDSHGDVSGDAGVTRAHARRDIPVPEPGSSPVPEGLSNPPLPPQGGENGSKDPDQRLLNYCYEALGRPLSPIDQEEVRKWRRLYWRLTETEIEAIVSKTVGNFANRGDVIQKFAAVMEGPLRKRQDGKVDERLDRQSKQSSGMTRIGDVL